MKFADLQKMKNLTQQIKSIDLAERVEAEGVKLKKGAACCPFPFHNDTDPSFHVYGDNRFKCFGCGEYGDVVDFLRLLYGYEFYEALRHLGIGGKLKAQQRRKIEKKRKIEAERLQRERNLVFNLGILIRATRKCTDSMTPEQIEDAGEIIHPLAQWEHYYDVLSIGSSDEKEEVIEGLKNMPVISRKYLFRPNFDYRDWLKEFESGVPNEQQRIKISFN